MAITDLALIRLSPHLADYDMFTLSPLVQQLQTAIKILQRASGYPWCQKQSIHSPSYVLIFGKWDSAEAHAAFRLSKKSKDVLALLNYVANDVGGAAPHLEVWQLDTDIFHHDFGKTGLFGKAGASYIKYERTNIDPEHKLAWETQFAALKADLQTHTMPFQIIGGWRVENQTHEGKEQEEWETFMGFSSEEMCRRFIHTDTDEYQKDDELEQPVQGSQYWTLRTPWKRTAEQFLGEMGLATSAEVAARREEIARNMEYMRSKGFKGRLKSFFKKRRA